MLLCQFLLNLGLDVFRTDVTGTLRPFVKKALKRLASTEGFHFLLEVVGFSENLIALDKNILFFITWRILRLRVAPHARNHVTGSVVPHSSRYARSYEPRNRFTSGLITKEDFSAR